MTATKDGKRFDITEMPRGDGRFQMLIFAPAGDLVRIHVDPSRDACVEALERDGYQLDNSSALKS